MITASDILAVTKDFYGENINVDSIQFSDDDYIIILGKKPKNVDTKK